MQPDFGTSSIFPDLFRFFGIFLSRNLCTLFSFTKVLTDHFRIVKFSGKSISSTLLITSGSKTVVQKVENVHKATDFGHVRDEETHVQ